LGTENINDSNSEQFCVVEGSSLSISFLGLSSHTAGVDIKSSTPAATVAPQRPADRIDSSCSVVSVTIIYQQSVTDVDEEVAGNVQRKRGEAVVADISPLTVAPMTNITSCSYLGITIRGISPGSAVIKLEIPGFLVDGVTLYKYFSVEVAPKVPVNNMRVVELLGVLEAGGSIGSAFDALAFASTSMAPLAGEHDISLMVATYLSTLHI
jgi:hypothetical protein